MNAELAMAQEVVLCDLCVKSPVQMHCQSCAINLCNNCIAKHISENPTAYHNLVVFQMKFSKPIFPRCTTHESQSCEVQCQQCDTPVCLKCLAFGSHKNHTIIDLMEMCKAYKDTVRDKTSELEKSIYPKCQNAICNLEDCVEKLPKICEELMSEISKQGEKWHQEVDIIINTLKQEVVKIKNEDLTTLTKLIEEMKNLLSTIRGAIQNNTELLVSNNVTKILERKSNQPAFTIPTFDEDFVFPKFNALPIQREQLHNMFGTVTASSLPHLLQPMKKPAEDDQATSMNLYKLLDSPESPSNIYTGYNRQFNVSCLSTHEVWVSGDEQAMKRFTIQGYLQETVNTATGRIPEGITVTRQGDLIFTDFSDRSINRVKKGKIKKIITLQEDWRPWTVCSTASDDLLVTMTHTHAPSRVVRYSGSTQKQIFQFDEQGEPLFSSDCRLFISENSDTDIIYVSDIKTNRVSAFNRAGELCFRYTGNLSSQKLQSFFPQGLAVDSMGNILVADRENNCIHIIDHQGHFVRYIDNCQLNKPEYLCLDKNNTLYVADETSSQVKLIKYCKGC